MTRNLKTLTMLASAVLLATTLTGCGEDAKTETAAKAAQARTQDWGGARNLDLKVQAL